MVERKPRLSSSSLSSNRLSRIDRKSPRLPDDVCVSVAVLWLSECFLWGLALSTTMKSRLDILSKMERLSFRKRFNNESCHPLEEGFVAMVVEGFGENDLLL